MHPEEKAWNSFGRGVLLGLYVFGQILDLAIPNSGGAILAIVAAAILLIQPIWAWTWAKIYR